MVQFSKKYYHDFVSLLKHYDFLNDKQIEAFKNVEENKDYRPDRDLKIANYKFS